MNRIVKAIATLAAGAGIAVTGWSMGSVAHAATARIPHESRAWWDRQACGQYAAWRFRHTDHSEDAALADSRHADFYLRSDIRGWVRHRENRTWSVYVDLDCTTGGDE